MFWWWRKRREKKSENFRFIFFALSLTYTLLRVQNHYSIHIQKNAQCTLLSTFFPLAVFFISPSLLTFLLKSELHILELSKLFAFFSCFRFASASLLFRFPLVSSIWSLSSMRRAFYERNFPNENKTWANKMCSREKRFRYTFFYGWNKHEWKNTSKLLNKKFDVVQGERNEWELREERRGRGRWRWWKKVQSFAKLDVHFEFFFSSSFSFSFR